MNNETKIIALRTDNRLLSINLCNNRSSEPEIIVYVKTEIMPKKISK